MRMKSAYLQLASGTQPQKSCRAKAVPIHQIQTKQSNLFSLLHRLKYYRYIIHCELCWCSIFRWFGSMSVKYHYKLIAYRMKSNAYLIRDCSIYSLWPLLLWSFFMWLSHANGQIWLKTIPIYSISSHRKWNYIAHERFTFIVIPFSFYKWYGKNCLN